MTPVYTVTPAQTKRLWQGAGAELVGHNITSVDPASRLIRHFVFDNKAAVCRRQSPTAHAASRVKVELDIQNQEKRKCTVQFKLGHFQIQEFRYV